MKRLLIGIGIAAAVVAVVLMVAIAGCYAYVTKDPPGLSVRIEAPVTASRGQDVELRVEVVNQRKDKPLEVSSIDVGERYLAGFSVTGTVPGHRKSEHIAVDDSRSFTFDTAVGAGETNVFIFQLRARKRGHFVGDVDVCEGMRFLTHVAETDIE